jgi:hypothetical protein
MTAMVLEIDRWITVGPADQPDMSISGLPVRL